MSRKPTATSSIETITPVDAEHILNCNTDNRPVRDSRVTELARAITEKRWHLTNDAIALTGTKERPGRLLNGQHRLWACLEAKQSIEVVMLYGVSEASYLVMDTGSKRTAGDAIGGSNSVVKAAAAMLVLCYERNQIAAYGLGVSRPHNDEIAAAYKAHPLIETSCDDIAGVTALTKSVSGCIAGFVIIREHDRARADSFIAAMLSGANLTTGSPELVLRNRLIYESSRARSKRLPSTVFMAYVVRAWIAKTRGEQLAKLQFGLGSAFPRIQVAAKPPVKRAQRQK